MSGSEKIGRFCPHRSTGTPSGRGYVLAMSVAMVAALLALIVFVAGRAEADRLPRLYLLPEDARYPEGIAADKKSGDFYVSSVVDGSIYRGNVTNEQVQ